MQLGSANTTDKSTLRGLARFYAGDMSSSRFSDSDADALINRALYVITTKILSWSDEWELQGNTATADLVADQRIYSFPSDILKIEKVQAKVDGSNWIELEGFSPEEETVPMSSESDITDHFSNVYKGAFYETRRDHIKIYSGSISGVTGGLKIWYTEEPRALSNSTDSPRIIESAQEFLPLYAAWTWTLAKGDNERSNALRQELVQVENVVKEFYQERQEQQTLEVTAELTATDYS